MSVQPLLTISAFARAVDLAPSALRYYDEAGLLPPAEVDPRSGYRYYTPELERRARLIGRMREVGVPVEAMRLVLDGSPDRAVELLRAFATEAATSARRTTDAVEDVVGSLGRENQALSPVVADVDGPELAAALRRVSRAADVDPASPLAVVLLDLTGADVVVVATDRYWLARWSVPTSDHHGGERRLVVQLRTVKDIERWLARRDQVRLSVAEDGLRLAADGEVLEVETVEDRFPAYRLVTEGGPPPVGRTTVDRHRLLAALGDHASSIRLAIAADRVTVSVHGSAEGVHLEATTYGSTVSLDFASALLGSALRTVVGDDVTLSYSAPDGAVCLDSPDQRNCSALVAPSVFEA